MTRQGIVEAVRQSTTWFIGAVVFPLSLLIWLVALKEATFASAIGTGELYTLAVEITGASLALELILSPGRLGTHLYRNGLMLLLLANILAYTAAAEVTQNRVVTSLDSGERTLSVLLFTAAVVFGVMAVARQALHRTKSES